ncbi:nucleotidyltransferase family protein [Paraburkholderia sp. 35.1]|uniref:nucleotidyltransferase family protein n=1 Tax=unclassified Paraburkholderia TaxID=2615204 RepID=UPI003D24801D
MIDDGLFDAIKRLRGWAQARRHVRRLWVYGSRLKGVQRTDSDLDVAMEIDPVGNDETARDSWGCHRTEWETEMTALVPYKVHLQDYDLTNPTSRVVAYIGCCAALVYQRDDVAEG